MPDLVVPTSCPYCGCEVTGAFAGNDPSEKEGALPGTATVCIGCTEVSIFDADMHLRRPSPEELATLQCQWDQIESMRLAIVLAKAGAAPDHSSTRK